MTFLSNENIFFFDFIGGIVSTICALVLLTPIRVYLGIPSSLAITLVLIAIAFTIYSFSCHKLVKIKRKLFLRVLIFANSVYALFIMKIALSSELLTFLGKIYFIIEFCIMAFLIWIEIKIYLKK